MVDEIYDRIYQQGRTELHDGVGRAFANIGHAIDNAFRVLNRIEYSAPWASRSNKVGRA